MVRYIVRLSPTASQATVNSALLSVRGVVATERINIIPAIVVEGDEGILADLQNVSGVQSVEPERQFVPMVADRKLQRDALDAARNIRGYEVEDKSDDLFTPSDDDDVSTAAGPTAVENATQTIEWVGGKKAREDFGATGSSVIAANLDTGACRGQFREDRQLQGADLTGASNNGWDDYYGHGSYTLGIMAGDDQTQGVEQGFVPEADLFPMRSTFGGSELLKAQDVVVQLAEDTGKPVIVNNSWGATNCGNICDSAVVDAIREASNHPQVYQVFAAGNEANVCGRQCNNNGINFGNSINSVLAVAASGRGGDPEKLHSYSSRGPGACGEKKPDVSAPIQGLVPWDCSTFAIGDSGGTSGACPHVAGTLAQAVDVNGGPIKQQTLFDGTRTTAKQYQGENEWNGCTGHGNVQSVDVVSPFAAGGADMGEVATVGGGLAAGLALAAAEDAMPDFF